MYGKNIRPPYSQEIEAYIPTWVKEEALGVEGYKGEEGNS